MFDKKFKHDYRKRYTFKPNKNKGDEYVDSLIKRKHHSICSHIALTFAKGIVVSFVNNANSD